MASTNPKYKNFPSLNDLLKDMRDETKKQSPPQQKAKKIISLKPQPLNSKKATKKCLECCDDMLGMLSIINDSASKILDALKAEKLLDKKNAERIRKEQEDLERREKENILESTGRKITGTFRKAVAPLQNVIDTIFKFILYTLAGRAIGKIIKWFSDPTNEKKIKTLSRFLSNWWPAILSAFVLFGTRFGKAIRTTIKMAVSTILHLKKMAIPALLFSLKKFGKTGLIIGAVGGAAIISKLLNPEGEDQKKENKITPEPKNDYSRSKPPVAMKSGGIVPNINLSLPNSTPVSDIRFAEGGHIREDSGISITGAGPDTQLIAAQPGEIIISKAAVDKFGADTFLRMNLMAGSSNRPKFANNIQFAVQGGMIGKNYQSNVTMPEMSINANIEKPLAFPKIQRSDYNMLLALSTAEGPTPQYRAEVAEKIYNQMQNKSFSKTVISDYIKTNKININVRDFSKIKDRRSAALFIAKNKNIGIQPALMLLKQTEDQIIANKSIMTSFDQKMNRANTIYQTNTPNVNNKGLYQSGKNSPKINIFDSLQNYSDTSHPIIKPFNSLQNYDGQIISNNPSLAIPGPRPNSEISISELPPIDIRKAAYSPNIPAHTDVPDFPLVPKISDRYGENGTLSLYEIEL